ncbi:MAG: response regulator transcription factor [Bacteroidota bacterium]
MERVSIIIADDHEIIHNGIIDILKPLEDLVILGHAYNGREAVDKALELNPDVIFMDIAMPELNGIEATRLIREENAHSKIIALTQYEESEYVVQFLGAGGNGYLLKNSRRDEFKAAIEAVLKNQRYLSYELSHSLLDSVLRKESLPRDQKRVHLTRREIEIIKKIADEKNNQEIADELNISLRTVETHRRNIMQKLEAKSVVSLLKYASQHKIIDL